MATAEVAGGTPASGIRRAPARQAYRILHFAFTVAPILAGLDKFLSLMVDWESYLWAGVPNVLWIEASTFMYMVGAIEIAAGILVAVKPRIGGYVVSAWLLGIIGNLILVGGYWDIALRDLGLALGALALARLAEAFEPSGGA